MFETGRPNSPRPYPARQWPRAPPRHPWGRPRHPAHWRPGYGPALAIVFETGAAGWSGAARTPRPAADPRRPNSPPPPAANVQNIGLQSPRCPPRKPYVSMMYQGYIKGRGAGRSGTSGATVTIAWGAISAVSADHLGRGRGRLNVGGRRRAVRVRGRPGRFEIGRGRGRGAGHPRGRQCRLAPAGERRRGRGAGPGRCSRLATGGLAELPARGAGIPYPARRWPPRRSGPFGAGLP